ncbi:cellulose binding domain-containing protein [Amycolatopsis sp. 195334CR]|uniref:cellulose binding domain-containing protein n=1 Tax=Amycolatopsis sp. 195334CR TaxID=2814588 RepID=UPI001A90060B|nr:cellulose binding domain-containing protein [Amycolatopsis sp. 195334CR]MBN6042234.1 cellulose binding domain-containing protein [Amycolatopsis sp. 195334CR]
MVKHRSWLSATAVAALLVLGTGATPATAGAPADVGTAAATAGCGKAPALNTGTHTISSGGKNRTYILKLPDGYDRNHPYRLIFGYHWWGGTANDVNSGGSDGANWAYYGQQRLANNSAIFVAPQGISNGWANSGGEDVTFTDDMIKQLEAALCVDTTQRFALGFSYGGGMSNALACARPTVFRAVAVYSGAQLSGCSGGTQPIAYMGIHGLGDTVLNISQGRALRDRFVKNNGCTPQNPPEPAQGSRSHIVTAYSGCQAGYPVVWAAFDGGHTPGPIDGCGCEGWQTWTAGEVWKFFSQFSGGGTPNPQPGACQVTNTVNAWNSGLTSELTITNTGTAGINGWSLAFTLPGGQTITSGWGAAYSPASGQVTATNVGYNPGIAAGGSVSIGFQATHTGNSGKPAAYSLNGATCTVA